MPSRESSASQLQVAGVVCFYIVAALVMVFVNKAVLNNTPDLPFTFLFIQLAIAVVLLHLLAFLSRTSAQSILPVKFEIPTLDLQTAKKLSPYLSVGLIGLIFNILCLANADASFFQIARGLMLPFTITVSAIHTHVRPRLKVIFAALLVTSGFLISAAPSLYLESISTPQLSRESVKGIMYGCLSSLVLAIHAVLNKTAITYVDNSVVTLAYWANLFMTVTMVPCLILHGELGVLQARFVSVNADWTTFAIGCAVTGVFGFLLGIASSLSIKVTSPITHMFSSAARSVVQTVLGVVIFGDIITTDRAYSISIITGGTIYYTWLQSTSKRPLPPPAPKDDVEKQTED